MSTPDRVAEFAARHHLPAVVLGVVGDSPGDIDLGDIGSGEIGLGEVVEYGYADPRRRTPATRDTLFRIASITKTFTATAVVQLRDQGVLSLDDPVAAHLPEFGQVAGLPDAAGRVTIRHLLQHSSGLQGEPPSLDLLAQPLHTAAQILEVLPRARILTPPGSAFRYSNLGFRVLAEVLHRVTGTRWLDLAPQRLLTPLGMTDSGATPREESRCAVGHAPSPFQDLPDPLPPVDSALAEGDGDLWTSLTDLARWAKVQLDAVAGRDSAALSAASLREMHQPTIVADEHWTEARGLGWNVLRRESGTVVSHGGLFAGFNSQLCFSPAHRVGVIALTNSVPGSSIGDLAFAVLDDVVAALPAPVPPVESPAAVPEHWADLLGRYHDPEDGQTVSIEFRKGRLVCRSGEDDYPLEPTEDRLGFRFDLEDWRFVTDGDGRVIAVNAHGYPLLKEQP